MKTFKELFIAEANLTGKTMKLKKDYSTYKKGTSVEVLEFKGSGQYRVQFPDKKTDVVGASALEESQDLDEKATWNHAEVAAQDVFNDLKSSGYNVKKSGNNGLKIIHDNGCVGNVVFDPSLKESSDELDESVKVGDGVFSKNDMEINGRVKAKQPNKSFISLSDVDMIKIAFGNSGGRGKPSQYKAGAATIIMQNDYDYVEIKKSLFGDEEFAALSIALKDSKLGKIK